MEFESVNKYTKSAICYRFRDRLPMQEYGQGNFSQAIKIIELYENLLQECAQHAHIKYTGREDGDRKRYCQEKETALKTRIEELKKAYNESNKKIQQIKKKKDELLENLQKIRDHENRKQFCDIVDKSLHREDINAIESRTTNPNALKKLQEAKELIDQIIAYNNDLRTSEQERAKYKHERNDGRNYYNNLEEQLKRLKNGKEREDLQEAIQSQIAYALTGEQYQLEKIQDTKKYFREILLIELVKQEDTKPQVREQLLKNHTDPIGVSEFLYSLHRNHKHINYNKQDLINSLTTYHEYYKEHTLIGDPLITQEHIQYISKILNEPKTCDRPTFKKDNKILEELFVVLRRADIEGVRGDLEESIGALRNVEYFYNLNEVQQQIQKSLCDLFWAMDHEDKKVMYQNYKNSDVFDILREQYQEHKYKQKNQQLLLWPTSAQDNRRARISILKKIITHEYIPDTLNNNDRELLASIVFTDDKLRLQVKKKKYANLENRRSSRDRQNTVRKTFLQKLCEAENNNEELSADFQKLAQHIVYEQRPLYKTFPIEITNPTRNLSAQAL